MNVIFYARHKNTITEAVRRRSGTWFSFRKKKMFEVPNCASGTFWPGGVSSEQAVMASAHTCAPERVLGGFKKLSFHFLIKHEVFSHIFFS